MLIPSTTSMSSKPRVILGLMTFGPPGTESKGARITSIDEYNSNLDYLQSQGYNEVDTARMYAGGEQEGFTKSANWKNRGLTLATKVYPTDPGMHSKDKLKETFNKSLKELGTDNVDIFYLHAPDRSVPFEETMQACNELFQEGKFQTLALSNFAAWEVTECVMITRERGWVQPKLYQAMYNPITRDIEKELVPCCRKYGLDIVIYNPLAGGFFSGKYKLDEPPSEGRFGTEADAMGKMYRARYFTDAYFNALKMIQPVVEKNNLTLLETALRWCVHHSLLKVGGVDKDGNDGIIIGVSSQKQLEGNLADLEKGPLPEEVIDILDRAWVEQTKAVCPSYWR